MGSNFNTLPAADRYAILKNEMDALTKQLDAVKAEIKATGLEIIEGNTATVVVSLSERASFDAKVAKTFLTEAQVSACTKLSLVETLRVKPVLKMAAE